MSGRKQLRKKRSPSYSKWSMNSDTDIVGSKSPHRRKGLAGNRVTGSFVDVNMSNETSRHLDSNSEIEESQVKDGWWNVLDNTDTLDSSNMPKDIVKRDGATRVSISESEEEPNMVKKRLILRSKMIKGKGNAFLNVLNKENPSEIVAKTKRESAVNNSISNTIEMDNIELLNTAQESTLHESRSVDNVLKLKANIYKRNDKSSCKNMFIDVLKGNELETTSKRISLVISSNDKPQTTAATTETLFFEDEHDSLHLPAPKAQSTVLEGSCLFAVDTNKESNSDSSNHTILRPKSKFLARQHKSPKNNPFERALEDEDTCNTKEENTLMIRNVKRNSSKVEKRGRLSPEKGKETSKGSLSSKMSITPSKVSNIYENSVEIPKAKSKFLTRSRKNGEKNLFQDILEEDGCIGVSVSLKSKSEAKEENTTKNSTSIEEESKRSKSAEERSKNSENLYLRPSLSSDGQDDNATTRKSNETTRKAFEIVSELENDKEILKEGRRKLRSSEKQSLLHVAKEATEVDRSKGEDIVEKLRSSTKLQRHSSVRFANRSELEEAEITPKHSSRNGTEIQGKTDPKKIESIKSEDTAKKQDDRLSKLQKLSKSMEFHSTPKRDRKSLSRRKKGSSLSVEEEEGEKDDEWMKNEGTWEEGNDRSCTTDEMREGVDARSLGRLSDRLKDSRQQLKRSTLEEQGKSSPEAEKKRKLPRTSELESEEIDSSGRRRKRNSLSRIANEIDALHDKENVSRRIDRSTTTLEDGSVFTDANKSIVKEANDRGNRESKEPNNSREPIKGSEKGFTWNPRVSGKAQVENEKRQTDTDATTIHCHTDDASKGQKRITNFFVSESRLPASQILREKDKVEEIKKQLERVKELEMACMKVSRVNEGKIAPMEKKMNGVKRNGKATSQKQQRPTKQVDKAFLVNGIAYKVPRLPRPQNWITDRLYSYLWKRMEPKYKLETRTVSEKFVLQMSNVTRLIMKRKSYVNYRVELHALMKEMARLGVVRTRNDFYHFCYEFFPYELRVKTVPMLLPGNKRNIPYDADELHEPILNS